MFNHKAFVGNLAFPQQLKIQFECASAYISGSIKAFYSFHEAKVKYQILRYLMILGASTSWL